MLIDARIKHLYKKTGQNREIISKQTTFDQSI